MISLLKILYIVNKYQLLIHNENIISKRYLRIIFKIIAFLFYPNPLNYIKKPSKSFATRLTNCIQSLGPIYIKFAQTLATREDILGQVICKHLQLLQDKIPPTHIDDITTIIKKDLGISVFKEFKEFNRSPIAAASIAQVYKAQLINDKYVAIKVLRPNIHERYNTDIKLLYSIAKCITFLFPKYQRLNLIKIVDLFHNVMLKELDLTLEAAAIDEMKNHTEVDEGVYIPKVYWNMVSSNILVTEWIDGMPIYDKKSLIANNIDLKLIAQKISVMFFNQAYKRGYFHADLHHGNILVTYDSNIALIDFGIMGRLYEKDRLAIAEILFSFLKRDYYNVAKLHLKVGYIPPNTNLYDFAQSCRAVHEISYSNNKISAGKLLSQLFKITEDFGMPTQPQLLLLQKTMVSVEGLGSFLDSDNNIWELAEPWIHKWAIKNITPEAKILRFIKNTVDKLLDDINIR